jgi:hypothetical protein
MNRLILKTLSASLFAASPAVFAAPVRAPTNLPLTGEDIAAARSQLAGDDEMKEFSTFITGLTVFPDHDNADDPLDRAKLKTFYLPPLFQPSLGRDVVGTQEIADWGIKTLENISQLATSFDLNIVLFHDVLSQIVSKRNILFLAEKKATETSDASAVDSLKKYVDQLRIELTQLETKRDQMLSSGAQGLESIHPSYRESVRDQIIMALAQLGITPTESEQINMMSGDSSRMALGIAQVVARAASGQYGVRQAIFESGVTAREKKWVSLYRSIRPDVSVVSLPTIASYVVGTAQSQAGNGYSSSDTVGTALMYRGVNIGSNGKCGNTYTCNIVLEYTSMGARMIALAKTGSVNLPVIFESEATFQAPDFEGTLECNFQNGWSAKGRSDVKDGAIIYDGDVYDKIHFKSDNSGGCHYTIVQGDENSAAYHLIKRIYDLYDKIFYERTLKSERDKAAYEKFVRDDLDRHAKQSQGQGKTGLFDNLSTWVSAFGSVWGTIATLAVNESRSFYWHTRVEDTSSIDTVNYKTTIKESNFTVSERFTYDGFPRVCWKKSESGDSYMSACPDRIEYKESADNDLGKSENNCAVNPFAACIENVENAPTNSDGVVVDPGLAW